MHTQAQTRTRMQYKRNSRKKVKTVRASATANKSSNNNKYNNKCNYLVAVICKLLLLLLRLHTKIYVYNCWAAVGHLRANCKKEATSRETHTHATATATETATATTTATECVDTDAANVRFWLTLWHYGKLQTSQTHVLVNGQRAVCEPTRSRGESRDESCRVEPRQKSANTGWSSAAAQRAWEQRQQVSE